MEQPTQEKVAEREPSPPVPAQAERNKQRQILVLAVVVAILGLAGVVSAVYWLLLPDTPTETIRDIFIIGMALELLLLGVSAVILIVQIARLVNLVNNELRPVLDSANETISTLRGTAIFMSENLAQPVIRVNSYLAAARRFLRLLKIVRD